MDKVISPDDIRMLAEEYVKEYHPDEYSYFGLAWDAVSQAPKGTESTGVRRWTWLDRFVRVFYDTTPPLPVAAVAIAMYAMIDELQRRKPQFSAKDFLPMIRACAKAARMPKREVESFAQQMAPRIQQYCEKFLLSADEAICANIIQGEETEKAFIWVGGENISGPVKYCLSKAEIDAKYRVRKNDYDLFLDNGLVSMKRGRLLEGVAIRGHTYEILLLLLIKRGEYQTDKDLYRRAWSNTDVPCPVPAVGTSGNDPSDGVRAYVKRIRGQLSGLSGFEITVNASEGGNTLRGNFSFCVILPVEKSGKYIKPLS